jgi:hypothetical protein
MRTVDLKVNGQLANTLVLSGHSERLVFNLSSDLIEIGKSLVEV